MLTSRSADVDKAYAAAGRTSHEVAQDGSRLDDGKDLKFASCIIDLSGHSEEMIGLIGLGCMDERDR